jgi:ParB family chromosome partitioning protein
LFNAILSKGLSVREAEKFARGRNRSKTATKKSSDDEHLAELERRLSRHLMTKVGIHPRKRGGSIEIRFSTAEELDRILEAILKR